MIEIKRMYHTGIGAVIFEDANNQWWQFESYNPEVGTAHEWMPVVATKIERPERVERDY